MQKSESASTPLQFDLSPLPDGFRRAVERSLSRGARSRLAPAVALADALSEAWFSSTAKQRREAEAGVNVVLGTAPLGDWTSYVVGVIGARCLDLKMNFVRGNLDEASVLRGAFESSAWKMNDAIYDAVDNTVSRLRDVPWCRQSDCRGGLLVYELATGILRCDRCKRRFLGFGIRPLPGVVGAGPTYSTHAEAIAVAED